MDNLFYDAKIFLIDRMLVILPLLNTNNAVFSNLIGRQKGLYLKKYKKQEVKNNACRREISALISI